jgi:hypothetical protein
MSFPRQSFFSLSDAESAVLMGRRKRVSGANNVGYFRICERELPAFRSDYSVPSARNVPQSRFWADALVSLSLPELEEVWMHARTIRSLSMLLILDRA